MKRTIRLLALLCALTFSYGFKKVVFKRGKTYYYQSVYIKPNGDTLAVEKHTWTPKGRPWLFQPMLQTSVIFNYYPDSVKTKNHPAVSSQKRMREFAKKHALDSGVEWMGNWQQKSNVGAIESKNELWIHPIRNDHFVYTEIAPFPCVELNKLAKDSVWYSGLWIGEGYKEFSGVKTSKYEVAGQKKYSYKNMILDSCWQVQSVSNHSKVGKNYHDYLYHPQHGFVEMKYKFYNGTRIEFYMVEVKDESKK